MTRLVMILVMSVKDAQEWLMKTELHLKEEGKKSFFPGTGNTLGLMVLHTDVSQVNLK